MEYRVLHLNVQSPLQKYKLSHSFADMNFMNSYYVVLVPKYLTVIS